MTTTKTATRPAARKGSSRTDRFWISAKHGAIWIGIWHVAVAWRDQTWPVAHTAITAVTAMAGSVL